MLAYLYKYVGVMKRNWYLLDASEIELKSGIDPGENLVPPYEVGTIHHPYIRRHCLFFLSLPSDTNNASSHPTKLQSLWIKLKKQSNNYNMKKPSGVGNVPKRRKVGGLEFKILM